MKTCLHHCPPFKYLTCLFRTTMFCCVGFHFRRNNSFTMNVMSARSCLRNKHKVACDMYLLLVFKTQWFRVFNTCSVHSLISPERSLQFRTWMFSVDAWLIIFVLIGVHSCLLFFELDESVCWSNDHHIVNMGHP